MNNPMLIYSLIIIMVFMVIVQILRGIIKAASKRDVERLHKKVSLNDAIQKPYNENDDYSSPILERDITKTQVALILAALIGALCAGLFLEF